MSMPEARRKLLEISRAPETEIDLAHACLWISAEEHPGLDVPRYLERIDALADEARTSISDASSTSDRVSRLNAFLFEQQRFRGNQVEYYDPRNSYLDQVLDRRLGIPITLSILWISVARRLGLDAHGVGFPGHFLALVQGDPPLIVDAFIGRTLSVDDCRARLREMAGEEARFTSAMLAPSPAREILARVLRNLKQIHSVAQNYESALACSERIAALQPNDVTELRDRGLLYRALECWLPALDDLEEYLSRAPGTPEAAQLASILDDLRRRTQLLH